MEIWAQGENPLMYFIFLGYSEIPMLEKIQYFPIMYKI